MDELEPLSTLFIEHPDYNGSDSLAEADRLFERQRAIGGLLDGSISVDTCLDLLDYQGINPHEWIDTVEANTDWVMSNGLILPA